MFMLMLTNIDLFRENDQQNKNGAMQQQRYQQGMESFHALSTIVSFFSIVHRGQICVVYSINLLRDKAT